MEKYDLVVIGGGPGGYVAAIRGAKLGLKTACIEASALGGTCLNVGCIPSKTLLHASELYHSMNSEAASWGIHCEGLSVDWEKVLARKDKVVAGFNSGIQALLKKNKVDWIHDRAELESAHEIALTESGQSIHAGSIILATGSKVITPSFVSIDEERILSSTGALRLKNPPAKLIVVGAGVIGLEMGSVFSNLGTQVSFIEMADRICPFMEKELSATLMDSLKKKGARFYLNSTVNRAKVGESEVSLIVAEKDKEQTTLLSADHVLCALGRKPNTESLGLQKLGIEVDDRGKVVVDESFRTSLENIYAIGDLIEGPMLAHKASEEGACVAAIVAGKPSSINYMAIPSVIYTAPEVAYVGMGEEEAKAEGLDVLVGKFPFRANSRAQSMGQGKGFVKVVAEKNSNALLGMHIIGPQASELIAVGVLAIEEKLRVEDLASCPFPHPNFVEAIKEASLDLTNEAIHI